MDRAESGRKGGNARIERKRKRDEALKKAHAARRSTVKEVTGAEAPTLTAHMVLILPAEQRTGVAARGIVYCGNQPSAGVRVRLYDLDRNPGDTDDLMAKAYSDRNGLFFLDGTTRELTNIEPQIRIYHDCADGIKECQSVRVIDVPGDYIYTDDNNKRVYDMGVVDLVAMLTAPGATEPRICQGDL